MSHRGHPKKGLSGKDPFFIQIVTEKDGSGGCGGGTEKGGYVVIGLDLTRLILQLVAEDVKHTANSNNGVIQNFVLTSFV